MPPSPPHDFDLAIGDMVEVPGKMHGSVRYIGAVDKKIGIFVGVELSEEFASKGKNSGDFDGISYFETLKPGAGIFLSVNRVTRRTLNSMPSQSSFPLTPTTPVAAGTKSVNMGSHSYTPYTPGISKFSQSVGNRRASSPQRRNVVRPSLPGHESPFIKKQPPLKPVNLSPKPKTPTKGGYSTVRRFGQSVRGTQDSRDPIKKPIITQRLGTKTSSGFRSTSSLSQSFHNNIDHNTTSTAMSDISNHTSLESSFNNKMTVNCDEVFRLRAQVEERDKKLSDQAMSLAEMEKALAEVQFLINADNGSRSNRCSNIEEKDVHQLRAMLCEKNDKISLLTAEFDSHRADFRSTIDTLEMASAETERVYEQRLGDLLHEIKLLADRTQDVDNVAKQLKQLEQLVQELEEGLEDARRSEVEARGEVEHLRGEVERTRAELKREREKSAGGPLVDCNGDEVVMSKELEKRDDEIRGLKKIIHSLNRESAQDNAETFPRLSTILQSSAGDELKIRERTPDSKNIKQEPNDLSQVSEALANPKDQQEDGDSRRESLNAPSTSTTAQAIAVNRNSRGTVISLSDRNSRSTLGHIKRSSVTDLIIPENDTYSSANESFCELCETAGHDILICTKVFNSYSTHPPQNGGRNNDPSISYIDNKSATTFSKKATRPPGQQVIVNPIDSEPLAGKESQVVNMSKWCAICERDGHESIDCPYEDTL